MDISQPTPVAVSAPIVPTLNNQSKRLNYKVVGLTTLFCLVAFGGGYYLGRQSVSTKVDQTALIALPTSTPTSLQNSEVSTTVYVGTTFSLRLPTTWEKDMNYVASPQNNEEVKFTTIRNTLKQAGGDYTPGRAELLIVTGASIETGFFELDASPSTTVAVGSRSGEQKSGYTGAAGSVYVIKTIVTIADRAYTITLSTQDEDLKATFMAEYSTMLSSFQFLN